MQCPYGRDASQNDKFDLCMLPKGDNCCFPNHQAHIYTIMKHIYNAYHVDHPNCLLYSLGFYCAPCIKNVTDYAYDYLRNKVRFCKDYCYALHSGCPSSINADVFCADSLLFDNDNNNACVLPNDVSFIYTVDPETIKQNLNNIPNAMDPYVPIPIYGRGAGVSNNELSQGGSSTNSNTNQSSTSTTPSSGPSNTIPAATSPPAKASSASTTNVSFPLCFVLTFIIMTTF
ncbi:CAMTA1 [Acrasis kona]|uniref:CAMTA1 n=1 Tax=Acrasis kona TaxID=1008807 RepID=A0AAW2YKZ3_9EUKA